MPMSLCYSTPVPNTFFDAYLPNLKPAELKIILVIIRQTLGWKDKKNPSKRKQRDWISVTQFQKKTGLSKKAITTALTSLSSRGLIMVTDQSNRKVSKPKERQRSVRNYYTCTLFGNVKNSQEKVLKYTEPEKKVRSTKETLTKENLQKIEEIKRQIRAQWGKHTSRTSNPTS